MGFIFYFKERSFRRLKNKSSKHTLIWLFQQDILLGSQNSYHYQCGCFMCKRLGWRINSSRAFFQDVPTPLCHSQGPCTLPRGHEPWAGRGQMALRLKDTGRQQAPWSGQPGEGGWLPVRSEVWAVPRGPSPAEGRGPRRGLGRAGTLEDSSHLTGSARVL